MVNRENFYNDGNIFINRKFLCRDKIKFFIIWVLKGYILLV